jgi:hypothetical protein
MGTTSPCKEAGLTLNDINAWLIEEIRSSQRVWSRSPVLVELWWMALACTRMLQFTPEIVLNCNVWRNIVRGHQFLWNIWSRLRTDGGSSASAALQAGLNLLHFRHAGAVAPSLVRSRSFWTTRQFASHLPSGRVSGQLSSRRWRTEHRSPVP